MNLFDMRKPYFYDSLFFFATLQQSLFYDMDFFPICLSIFLFPLNSRYYSKAKN